MRCAPTQTLPRRAGGSASSAAGLRAISVSRFMIAARGGWIGGPVLAGLSVELAGCTEAAADCTRRFVGFEDGLRDAVLGAIR